MWYFNVQYNSKGCNLQMDIFTNKQQVFNSRIGKNVGLGKKTIWKHRIRNKSIFLLIILLRFEFNDYGIFHVYGSWAVVGGYIDNI